MKRLLILLLLLIPATACADPLTTHCVTVSPTVDTSIYASGDNIGGEMTFTKILPDYTGSGTIVSVEILDKAAQAVDMDLVIFTTEPASSYGADQAVFDPADSDLGKIATVINFGSSTRFAFNDNGVKYIGSIFLPVVSRTSAGALSRSLFGQLVSRGTPTFGSSSDVSVKICVAWDSN